MVYCHGNCGSRIDSFEIIEYLLTKDICIFIFDFAGSGLSEGKFVTLGYFEQDDVATVVEYLDSMNLTSSVGL